MGRAWGSLLSIGRARATVKYVAWLNWGDCCGQDVKAVAWHPDGEILVSCSYDDSIKLWREAGGDWMCEQTLSGTVSLAHH